MLRLSMLLAAAVLLANCGMGQYPLTGLPVNGADPVHSMQVP